MAKPLPKKLPPEPSGVDVWPRREVSPLWILLGIFVLFGMLYGAIVLTIDTEADRPCRPVVPRRGHPCPHPDHQLEAKAGAVLCACPNLDELPPEVFQ